jgi:hypothetical protein
VEIIVEVYPKYCKTFGEEVIKLFCIRRRAEWGHIGYLRAVTPKSLMKSGLVSKMTDLTAIDILSMVNVG